MKSEVSLSVTPASMEASRATIELRGLNAGVAEALRQRRLTQAEWALGFAVFVNSTTPKFYSPSAVLADYDVLDDRVRLTPTYPWIAGLEYRAFADLGLLLSGRVSSPTGLTFSVPKEVSGRSTEVDNIYPSGHALPENLLRLYVHFSAPMERGGAYDQIKLCDEDGCVVPDALYRPPVELWAPSMRRLTVLLDPGRLKRNVGPNAKLGAPMKQGRHYMLLVGAGLIDATGCVLNKPCAKSFFAGAPVRARILPERWKISAPQGGTFDPLRLEFQVPLDFALGSAGFSVVDSAQGSLAGRHILDQEETRWTFTPVKRWLSGEIRVQVDPSLEDVCGNRLISPFDASAWTLEGGNAKDYGVSVRIL